MRFFPHTDKEIQKMLAVVGAKSIDDLFRSIPESVRLKRPLNLPPPLAEHSLKTHMKGLASENKPGVDSFLGGGIYYHFIPGIIPALIGRGEFLTAYTPYQPEVSQGTLQAIFQYQTMIAELFGMDLSNASNYDGATAAAEAFLMALRIRKKDHGPWTMDHGPKNRVLVARSLHPQYRNVIHTYLAKFHLDIEEIPFNEHGECDEKWLANRLAGEVCAVAIGYPNYFGVIEPLDRLIPLIKSKGAVAITVTTEPLSLAILKPPGAFGADIAAGEGQSLGIPPSLGGPSLGLFTAKKEHARNMPGRLVGETVDVDGRRGYAITLATREQHIRRERATSNICTNVSLCALASSIYLSLLGKNGLKELAEINFDKASYARERLKRSVKFSGPMFNEFVVEGSCKEGIAFDKDYPELKGCRLLTFTEMNSRKSIDKLCEQLT